MRSIVATADEVMRRRISSKKGSWMAGSEFNLRVAFALTEDVRTTAESVFKEARVNQLLGELDGFLGGLKSAFENRGEIANLHGDLDRASVICDGIGGEVTVPHPEDPDVVIGALSVKSTALFCKGLVTLAQGKTPEALELMNESLAVQPDQETLYQTGLIFLQLKEERGDRGVGNKILGRTLAKMVRSGSAQEEGAVDAFRKCVEMDSESEVGVRAGMELARLDQL